jgi:hypothetical protein
MSYAAASSFEIHRRLRILFLVDAAEKALMAPVTTTTIHLMAYLTNVLAPVWEVPVLDGKLLKKGEGPFYPELQADADAMVGQGLLLQSKLDYVLNVDNQWRLQGVYTVNHSLADRLLDFVENFEDEHALRVFCTEVAYSLSALVSEQIQGFSRQDATYGDPLTDFGSVIDFAEWMNRNFASNAAIQLGELLPSGSRTTPAEKIHSYVRHLSRRLYASR